MESMRIPRRTVKPACNDSCRFSLMLDPEILEMLTCVTRATVPDHWQGRSGLRASIVQRWRRYGLVGNKVSGRNTPSLPTPVKNGARRSLVSSGDVVQPQQSVHNAF